MSDLLGPYGRNDPCWCGSGKKYKVCHGTGPRFPPGAPIEKESKEGETWIAPDVALSRQAMDDMLAQMTGAPIFMPSDEMQQPPLQVSQFSARLAEVEALQPSLPFGVLGGQRFEVLDGLGLTDPKNLRARLETLSADDYDALVHATFSTARATLDRLLEQTNAAERPTALWGETSALPHLVRQTLFWADHYLVPDDLAQELIRRPGREHAPKLARALESLVQLQPLIELGVVVPVPEEVLSVLTANEVVSRTEGDLEDDALRAWLLDQMDIEGPSAREVLFVRPRDSWEDQGAMYFYGHVVDKPDEDGTVTTASLQQYDPAFDYSAWIEQSRRKTASGYLQETNRKLAIAEALGAELLADSPFEARLLQRKGRRLGGADALLRTRVPIPADVSVDTLARIAAEDEAVAALRSTVRRAFTKARGDSAELAAGAAELVEDLDQQAHRLKRQLSNDRTWRLAIPAGLSVSSLIIGGALAGPPVGVAGAAAAALSGLSPYIADQKERHEQPAYALLLAQRASRDR